ncbi:hypothetical protein GCM10011519_21150 [Marmoricola endophyticus]|uniref:DUF2332 domain-containing protein n=2 Tax=Marmoricola endophyticus TaxID=2040280 RepID=A0A917F4W4_9ACTN|nr:hypothetical protein GCM10011519_21150 [Marmoricola endophyticus]
MTDGSHVARDYRFHAAEMSSSPSYRAWALGIAEDPETQAVIAALPAAKQQANLVFAAARWHGARPGSYDALRATLLGPRWPQVRATILERRTQTNEVGRLTALVPALGMLGPGPFALVELGASAGLCLYPDRYDYDWGERGCLTGSGGPTLATLATGPLPVPAAHPRIAARVGVDLHPLDVSDAGDRAWLLTLVWPEHEERRTRLAAALDLAGADRPTMIAGDMLGHLKEAVALAESCGATPVVHHSAAVAYLDGEQRERLDQRLRELVAAGRCHWVSLEGARVLPRVTATAPVADEHRLCLAVDGRAVAWAHGHGADLSWFG